MNMMIKLNFDKINTTNIVIAMFVVFVSLSFTILGPVNFFLFFSASTILVIVFVKPLYGLSILAFSIPFAGIMQIGEQMTANKVFALYVMISFFVGALVKNKKLDIFSSNAIKIYVLFYVWLLIVFLLGSVFVETIKGFLSQFFLLGLVILTAAMPKNYQEFKIICISTAVGSCSLGMYTAMFGMGSLVGQYGTRLAAGTNENVLAHALGVGLLLSFFALQESTKLLKAIILILDFFTIYAIFLTGSRGTWIALSISVILIPLFAQTISLKKRLNYVLMGSLVIFTVFIGLRNNYFGNWGKLINDRLTEDNSITQAAGGRLDSIWPYYLNKFYEKPIAGWGAGFSHDVGMAVHNDFLNIMVETGMIGLVLYLIFLLFALKDILRNRNATLRLKSLILFVFLAFAGVTHNTMPLKSYALAIGALCFLAKLSNIERNESLADTVPQSNN